MLAIASDNILEGEVVQLYVDEDGNTKVRLWDGKSRL